MINKQEHFCHFFAFLSRSKNNYSTNQPLGFLSPRMAFITKGSCKMTTPNGFSLTVNAGDVWYIPKNQPYSSVWTADGYVEFYYFEFESDFFSNDYINFEKIENSDLKENFIKLHEYYTKEEKISAVAEFYNILNKTEPFLTKKSNKHLEVVLPALEHIHKNFNSKIKVSDLAELCFLSESRFYSLFKNIMTVSPIEYKNSLKIARAIELLQSGYTLEKICEQLNFSSSAFLRSMIKKYSGQTPRNLKKGAPL